MTKIKLTNKTNRALGFPGARPVVLGAGQSIKLPKDHLDDLLENATVSKWLDTGLISVKAKKAKPDESKSIPIPEAGVAIISQGNGWYRVYYDGEEASESNMRKADAEVLAAEYE